MSALLEDRNWRTFPTERTVVIGVHTVAAAMRLIDIAELLNSDPRVAQVYVAVPDRLGDGVERVLEQWESRRVSWDEATRSSYDLAIGASLHQLESLPAKSRFATPHGAGYNKRWPSWAWSGSEDGRPTYGLDCESLVDKTGQLVVDALNLSHLDQSRVLFKQCPQAIPAAFVGGDPAFDRLLASMPFKEVYRAELNVRPGQTLVAVTSTWGQASLLATQQSLLGRLLDELPANHRVILTMHPAVWSEHGPVQIKAALRKFRGAGLDIVDAGEDWRGLLAAADVLVGDHTSVSVYGAASGVPFLLSHFAEEEIDQDSVMADLARHSPILNDETSLLDQLEAARRAGPAQQRVASERVSSVPGQSAGILRRELYKLLGLREPASRPRVERVRSPRLVAGASGC